MNLLRRALLFCSWLCFTACGSAPTAQLQLAVPGAPLRANEFPGADRFLQGFAGNLEERSWRRGDAVLYGLRLRQGERQRHWLLHAVVDQPAAQPIGDDGLPTGGVLPDLQWDISVNGTVEQFVSPLCRVAVTVADANGTVLGQSRPLLPRQFLEHGFVAACQQVQRVLDDRPMLARSQDFYDHVDSRELAEAVVCAVALVQVVEGDEVLSPLLWAVVQRPSLLSLVANFGVDVVIQPSFHAAVRAKAPPGLGYAGPVWSVPMQLLVNGTPALLADLLVGSAEPPLHSCGGILGVTARHPTAIGVEFSMLLLAAQRGSRVVVDQRSLASGRETALDKR